MSQISDLGRKSSAQLSEDCDFVSHGGQRRRLYSCGAKWRWFNLASERASQSRHLDVREQYLPLSCTACGVATDRSWQRLGALFLRIFRWKVVNVPHHCIVTVSVAMLREQSTKESYFLVITASSRSTCRTSAVLCSRWQLGARPVPSVLIGGLGKTHRI